MKGVDVSTQSRKFGEMEWVGGWVKGLGFTYGSYVSKEIIKFTLEVCERWRVWCFECALCDFSDRTFFRWRKRALSFKKA